MRNIELTNDRRLRVFNHDTHSWDDTKTHNKLKPKDIFYVCEKDWKIFCDRSGEYIMYCESVNLEHTPSTIYYTPLRKRLSLLSQVEQDKIISDKKKILL